MKVFPYVIAIGSLSVSAADNAADLLDQAITAPGSYTQMCFAPVINRSPLLPLYGLFDPTEYELSTRSLHHLRASRPAVIQELVKRLSPLSWGTPPMRSGAKVIGSDMDSVITDTGLDPHHMSSMMLKIIADLNATDCLPDLLRLEESLSQRLEAHAADHEKNPLPVVQTDISGIIEGSAYTEYIIGEKEAGPEIQAAIEAEQRRVNTMVLQRNMLSCMLILLRLEKYPPLLQSEIEAQFAAAVQAQAKTPDLVHIKKAGDIPETERAYVMWDDVIQAPYHFDWPQTNLTYTPELRQQIIDLTRNFLLEISVDQRLGIKGMLPRPTAP